MSREPLCFPNPSPTRRADQVHDQLPEGSAARRRARRCLSRAEVPRDPGAVLAVGGVTCPGGDESRCKESRAVEILSPDQRLGQAVPPPIKGCLELRPEDAKMDVRVGRHRWRSGPKLPSGIYPHHALALRGGRARVHEKEELND